MKKIQLYVDEVKDKEVYDLISKLEEEANGSRGYVQDKLKERLRAFKKLSDLTGSNDPMDVLLAFAQANQTNKNDENSSVKPQSKASNDTQQSILEIGNQDF